MLQYPDIDPVAVSFGSLKIHWYGITYLVAFLVGWWLAKYRASKPNSGWKPDEIGDIVFYIVLGVIAGGKIGSVVFYQWDAFTENPAIILNLMKGGMSFHGGLLGVLLAMLWYAKRNGRTFFEVTDFLAPAVPPGLGFGRIGNFINGELWGKPTDVAWGFKVNGQTLHASQLYEALLEGLVLFLILWWFSKKPRKRRAVSGLFLLGYGVFRFLVEFVRVPDSHIGYEFFGWMTRGQQLCIPMIVFGIYLLMSSKTQVLNKFNDNEMKK